MKSIEDRVAALEKSKEEADKSFEDLSVLIDTHQAKLQRSITELSGHMMESLRPMIRQMIREERDRNG